MCRVLGVSTSGYYAWRKRPISDREHEDQMLSERIMEIYEASRRTYGSPNIHRKLRKEGIRVGRKRVARLMREAGLRGVSRRKSAVTTTRSSASAAEDLVKRDFEAEKPDELWVADITYVPTDAGFLYLSVVLDAFSRKVVGWKMASHLRTELVLAALDMAVHQRRPDEVIHHSDRGSQYTSIAFGKRCQKADVRPSMGQTCFDNALCESFFATLECELIERDRFATRAQAKMAIFEFIESWYNQERQHSSIEYHSPTEFENLYLQKRRAA